jgi:hypothetical protein
MAGAYLALRLEALRSDPSVLAIRHTGSAVQSSRSVWARAQHRRDVKAEPPGLDRNDPDADTVERVAKAAAKDDGFRVQLLDLAALHGGLYEKAVNRLYAIEIRTLGRWHAEARNLLDRRQIAETRKRDAESDGLPE